MSSIYQDEPAIIVSWLSTIHTVEPAGIPCPPCFDAKPVVVREAPASWSLTPEYARSLSIKSISNLDQTSLAILNSEFRSTWELLKALPAPAHTMRILPILPTHCFTPSELERQMPDQYQEPLQSTMISLAAAEAEYARVLDLRECLRVEEIMTELKADMERLYLDPPSYQASQSRLADVRLLLMKACRSLPYIKNECATLGINLDVTSIDERRAAKRPVGHPFNTIAIYLKDDAIEEFHNFEAFNDIQRLKAGNNPHCPRSGLNLSESDHGEDDPSSDGSITSEDPSD